MNLTEHAATGDPNLSDQYHQVIYPSDPLNIDGWGIVYSYMDVSKNRGIPKSSHFNRVFHYKPSILGTPIFGNTHIQLLPYIVCVHHLGVHLPSFGGFRFQVTRRWYVDGINSLIVSSGGSETFGIEKIADCSKEYGNQWQI